MAETQGLNSEGQRDDPETGQDTKALEALLADKADSLYCWTCHFESGDVMIITAGRDLALYVAERDKRIERVIEWRLNPESPLHKCIYRKEQDNG